jgi:hypothetical protein
LSFGKQARLVGLLCFLFKLLVQVMCDCYTPQGEPIPTNKRYNAAKVFSHPDVAAEVPWYENWSNFLQYFASLENISILL